jgi:hypothetical protein
MCDDSAGEWRPQFPATRPLLGSGLAPKGFKVPSGEGSWRLGVRIGEAALISLRIRRMDMLR